MSLLFKGKPEGSLSFNGVDQYVQLPNEPTLRQDRLDAFSVSAWVRTLDTFGTIYCTQDDLVGPGLGGQGLHVFLLNGQFQLRFWGLFGQGLSVGSQDFTTINDGKWHHVLVTKTAGASNSGTISMYVDGISSAIQTYENDLTSTSTISSGVICIGARNADSGYLNGYLRDVQYYDYELTAGDASTIYNNSHIFDTMGSQLTGNKPIAYWKLNTNVLDTANTGILYDGTLINYGNNGLRKAAPKRQNSYSLNFDGVTQYGSMPHDSSLTFVDTDQYTIAAWVAHDGTDGGYIISKIDSSLNGWGATIEGNGQMRMIQEDDSTGLARIRYSNTGAVPSDDNPHLLIYRYNGSADVTGMTMFIDNNEVSSYITFSNSAANTFGGTNEINFAARSSGTGALKKQKQYWVAVYSGVITEEEMEAIYLAGPFAPPPRSNRLLTAWFNNGGKTTTVPAFPADVTLNNGPSYKIEKYQPSVSAGKLDDSFSPVALYNFDTTVSDSSGNLLPDFSVDTGQIRYARYQSGASGFYSENGNDILDLASSEASLQITGDLTIQITFYCRSLSNTSIFVRQSGPAASETSADNTLYQLAVLSDGSLDYFAETGSGTDITYSTPTGIIEEGKIYHISLVRESNILYFYVNGILLDTSGVLSAPTDGSNGTFQIGQIGGLSILGVLSNVKIIASALTEDEIQQETDKVFGRVRVQ